MAKLAESKVKIVRLIGRRGVLQVAFTIKEFREISNLSDVRTLIDNSHFEDIISILQGKFSFNFLNQKCQNIMLITRKLLVNILVILFFV